MFNNLIFFILALLLYETRSLGPRLPIGDIGVTGGSVLFFLTVFALETRRQFQRLYFRAVDSPDGAYGLQRKLQQTTQYLMVLSIIFFAAEIYLLDFKSLVAWIPGSRRFSSLQGLSGISLYLGHVALIWYWGFPVQSLLSQASGSRGLYIRSQFQFNLPILFPWLSITLLSDLVDWLSGPKLRAFLDQPLGEIAYILAFLVVLSIFFPFLIKTWWQCRPLPEGPKQARLEEFCREMGAPFRAIFLWPAFGGKILTAGVMGLVKHFRYLLITPSLLELLDQDELIGVVAHEIGHIRKKHLFFYLFFFAGYILLAVLMGQWISVQVLSRPGLLDWVHSWKAYSEDLYGLLQIVPVALGLILYFRFLFGYFMRNFERQADLFALEVLGSPGPLIQSLEKIGFASGQTRNLPSWHHFSIAQRVEFLEKVGRQPELAKGHHKKVYWSVTLFLLLLLGAGLYGLQQQLWSVAGRQDPRVLESLLNQELQSHPKDTKVLLALAMIYQEGKRYGPARENYEKILKEEPNNVWALNNLAWLLATNKDPAFFDPEKALTLAKRAASLKPDPMILDTLAEAFHARGRPDMSLKIMEQILEENPPNRSYYQGQAERFRKAVNKISGDSASPSPQRADDKKGPS
jgi:Zn-dependent protease with chaperone function